MQLSDLTITQLGKGIYRAECAPADPPAEGDVALPTTRAELLKLIAEVQAGAVAPPVERDLFGEMQAALRAEGSPYADNAQYDDLHCGEAAHVLYFHAAVETAGGVELAAPLSPEAAAAFKEHASIDKQERAEVVAKKGK